MFEPLDLLVVLVLLNEGHFALFELGFDQHIAVLRNVDQTIVVIGPVDPLVNLVMQMCYF